MNAAHFHLIINHFPLIGFVFSFLILAVGLFRKNDTLLKTGFWIILLSSLLTIPTYLSGEPAEELIEKFPTFSEAVLEPHEEAAELAIWFVGIAGLSAAAALWASCKKPTAFPLMSKITLLLNIVALLLVGRVSNLGGKIAHPEIRDGATTAAPNSAESSEHED